MFDGSDTLQRNPMEWKSGHAPMTDAQRVDLDMLAAEAGEASPDDNLNQAEASERIKELRRQTGIYEEDADTVLGDDE